ncbi:MAG: DUF559 domain-containing protein [Longimicrobiales bacterium]
MIRQTAAAQDGVISRRQFSDAGVPIHVLDYRLKSGRYTAVVPGVYRVGCAPTEREHYRIALLSSAPDAVLSHWSAAEVLGFAERGNRAVHVTASDGPRKRPGLRLHRIPVSRHEVTRRRGLTVTTAPRTLVDLSSCSTPTELERTLARAIRGGHTSPTAVGRSARRHARRNGVPALRALLERLAEPAFTRSDAEARFLQLVRKGGLPAPKSNHRVERLEVDFVWPRALLVVEIDGFLFHSTRTSFEWDRARDRRLVAAGYRVVRVTWRQIESDEAQLLAQLSQMLGVVADPRQ